MSSTLVQLAAMASTLPQSPAGDIAACAAILDLVTAAAAAPARPMVSSLQASFGNGPCAVWFSGQTAAPAAAGFANSFAAAALDMDDGHRRSRGHPGAAVIPAVFAEADRLEAMGELPRDRDILHAVVVGYEVAVRVASSRGFYARTGYWGGYGAAAGVAKLRSLDAARMAQALAIAGETSPHMLTTTAGSAWPQPEGSDVKEGIPWSVANGIVAVGLAEASFTGPLDMLDHKPFFDGEAIVASRPTLAIQESYTKFYACCRHLHAPIDALMAVMTEHKIAAAEIETIEVRAYSGALRISNRANPANLVDAQYSIPYCLALAALHGPEVLLPLVAASLHDREATELAGRVRLSIDAALEARFPIETPVQVAVSARGQHFVSAVTTPRGEAGQSISWAERVTKFEQATRFSLTDIERQTFLRAIEALAANDLGPLRRSLGSCTRAAEHAVLAVDRRSSYRT